MFNSDVKGLVIVNALRQKLTDKIGNDINSICNLSENQTTEADKYFSRISGLLAVANALDIIMDEEYAQASQTLIALFNQEEVAPIAFGELDHHYCKDYGLAETMVVFKVNLQERFNENLARYRQPSMVVEYSKNDIIQANSLIIEFGKEFAIIKPDEYTKAVKILNEYRSGKPKTQKLILIPEQFYTKL